MAQHNLVEKAEKYLHYLSLEIANRRTGSTGNRQATAFVEKTMVGHAEMVAGDPWYQGDHAIFYQNQVPALAITSEQIMELTTAVTPTEKDVPALVDCGKLVHIAQALRDLIQAVNERKD